MSNTPGLVIAAPRSGSGKTTLTLGLLRALTRRGARVAGAKSGPDYIDPAFHTAACGRPSMNLDAWAMPPGLITRLAAQAGAGCDLVLCEGSMGLFDGVPAPEPGRTGSSADVAAALGWPVLLIHDVSGQSQSAAAQILGCLRYDPRLTVAGVVLNRIGSARHERLVREALAGVGIPVLGALPRTESIVLPERHLGLVQAAETAELDERLEAMADLVAAHVDLDAVRAAARPSPAAVRGASGEAGLLRSARNDEPGGSERKGTVIPGRTAGPNPESSPSSASWFPRSASRPRNGGASPNSSLDLSVLARFSGEESAPSPLVPLAPPGQRIAIARDEAFSFLYPHVLDGWRVAGAEVRVFSPLADEAPPDDCDACWLPGGYPELHAGALASAGRFLAGLRRFAATRPVHGECGGYMVLGRSLQDADGTIHAMAGLLGLQTSFAVRRLHLGYREARLLADCCLGAGGMILRGHEFHYASIVDQGGDAPLVEVADAYGSAPKPAGSRRGHVTGGYFHTIATA